MDRETGRERGLRDIIRETVQGYMRGGEIRAMLGRARASADAQGTGDGIGIDQIRRAVAEATIAGSANTAVSATSLAALGTPLSVEVVLSGRPIRIVVSGTLQAGAGGGTIALHALLRRADLGIICFTNTNDAVTVTGTRRVLAPRPGRAVVEVHGVRTVADGLIFTSGGHELALEVVEL